MDTATNKVEAMLANPLLVEYFNDFHHGNDSVVGFAANMIAKYFHRPTIYHSGQTHIWPMLEKFADVELDTDESVELQFVGYFFALFHDCINESIVASRQEFNNNVNLNASPRFRRLFEMVHEAIQASDYRFESIDQLPAHAIWCITKDVEGLNETDLDKVAANEKQIFREYQKVEFTEYREARLMVLDNIYKICNLSDEAKAVRFDFIQHWQPRIAVFAGSFNPFHIGHLNVLQQAEKDFDKVIVAVYHGQPHEVSSPLKHHQVDRYTGMLVNYLRSKPYPVTLVRGLRNSHDLQYEQNLKYGLQDIMPDINIVYYLTDRDVGHISSTLCREVSSYSPLYDHYTSIGEYDAKY